MSLDLEQIRRIARLARIAVSDEEAAATAGRHLFGTFPVDFLLTVATVDNYGDAK